VVPKSLPAVPFVVWRKYLILVHRPFPRRRSLFVAGT
jgi:hypothetical protein